MNFFEKLWAYGFVYPLSQLYRATLQNLWDLLGNTWWYLRLGLDSDEWEDSTVLIEDQRNILYTIAQKLDPLALISEAVANGSYELDGIVKDFPVLDRWPTWTQTVRIHLHRKCKGNCQDHMHFAKWNIKFLNSIHEEGKRWKFRKNIYTPIHPFYAITKSHYFLSVISPNGDEYQISNGKVTLESRDGLASRVLGDLKYIWLTSESWSE